MRESTIVCASSVPVVLESFQMWLIGYVGNRESITSLLFPLQKSDPYLHCCDLLIAFVFDEQDAIEAEKLSLCYQKHCFTGVMIAISSHAKLFTTLSSYEVRVPYASCMPVVLEQIRTLNGHHGGCSERGVSYLFTKREREVLLLLSQGMDTKQISSALHISIHTVHAHRRNLYVKANVHSLQQLILYASAHRGDLLDMGKERP